MSRMSWISRTCPPLPWLRPRTRRMATHLHLRGQGNFLWPNLSGQGGGAGGITQGRGRSAAAGYVASAHTAARDGLFEDVAVDEGRGQGGREGARPSLPRRGQSVAWSSGTSPRGRGSETLPPRTRPRDGSRRTLSPRMGPRRVSWGGVGAGGEVERGGRRRGPAVSDEVVGRRRGCCCDDVRGGRDGNSLPMPQAKARWRRGRGRSGRGRFGGSFPRRRPRAGVTTTQVVPAVDELVLAAEAVTAEMTQQPTCWYHPYATIYQQQRQGGGGRM